MIDFVTVRGEAFPLITDMDFLDARAAMMAVGIDSLPIFRACTDDLEDFVVPGYDDTACLSCDVVETDNVLWAYAG